MSRPSSILGLAAALGVALPLAIVGASAIAACGSDAPVAVDADGDGGSTPPDASGAGQTCPANMLQSATDSTCVPGGWAPCFEGSRPREGGWGCEEIIAEAACTGATREVIGKAECVPVGDCSAPFPPAAATLFVSPTATPDATHFTTLVAAIAAAPAGAVIAVDRGDYLGSVRLTKDVTIIGRCPAEVTLRGQVPDPGIRVDTPNAVVRGLSVTKTVVAVSLAPGGGLVLEDVVLDDNILAGISLSDGNAKLEASRIVVRGTRPSGGERGTGANVQASSKLVMRDATLAGNTSQNIRVSTESEAVLEGVVLRDCKASALDIGRGLQVADGAKVKLTRGIVVDNYEVGIVAGDRADLDLRDVVVARTKPAKSGSFGRAVNAFGGATIRAEGLHVYDNHDASIMLAEANTKLTLKRSTVVDTQFDEGLYVGRGITVQEGASLDAEDCAVSTSREVGVAAFSEGTKATMKRSIVRGTLPNGGDYFGHGFMTTAGGALVIENSEIVSNVGVGIAVGTGSVSIAGVRIRQNEVGLYVQDGTSVREVTAAETPNANEVTVAGDCIFQGNRTRLSAGTVPLPEPSTVGSP